MVDDQGSPLKNRDLLIILPEIHVFSAQPVLVEPLTGSESVLLCSTFMSIYFHVFDEAFKYGSTFLKYTCVYFIYFVFWIMKHHVSSFFG